MTVIAQSTLTWTSLGFVLFVVVVFLIIAYLRGGFYKHITYNLHDVPKTEESYFPFAMMAVSNSIIAHGQVSNYWYDIDTLYQARLNAIAHAQHTIHFESFYMTPGRRVKEFADAMIERARAGVKVLVLVDSFGVEDLSSSYWQRLSNEGVNVRFFHPFDWRHLLSYNIRDHRKLLVIDGEIAFIGGTGVSDYWDGNEEAGDIAPWLDFEFSLTGSVVSTLESIFMQHWIYTGGVAQLKPRLFQTRSSTGIPMIVTPTSFPSASSALEGLFYTCVMAAQKRLWIASPYFLPSANARQAMLEAKQRGVDVRILTVGPHNDKKMIYYAVRERYRDLLKGGIEIYEYQPSMMHAKVFLIDETFVSTGSANYDPRSLFHNDELNVSVSDADLAQFVEKFFLESFAKSDRIDLQKWRKRSLLQRIQGQLALLIRWQL
ncbi:MAG: phospholipase D-like domain-containing protein [Chroococcales cyanobacterium]